MPGALFSLPQLIFIKHISLESMQSLKKLFGYQVLYQVIQKEEEKFNQEEKEEDIEGVV